MFPSHSSGPPAIFMVFFFVIFAIVVARILFKVVGGLGEWSSNNSQPVLTGEAEIVSKQAQSNARAAAGPGGHRSRIRWKRE